MTKRRNAFAPTAVWLTLAALPACGDDSSPAGESSTGPDPTTGVATTSTTGDTSGTTGVVDTSTGVVDTGTESTTAVATESSGTEGTSTETTGGSESSGTTGEPIDCGALPAGPLGYTVKQLGGSANEDFAWDDQGNMVGHNGSAIFRTQYDGAPQLWVPGVNGFIAGFRATSDGVFVYNDVSSSTLMKINDQGAPQAVLGGWNYANGMDVGLDGHVYVAEESAGRVRRVNVETGEFTILAEDLYEPNGVSFSPDYSTLYVGSFGGGTVTAISLDENMEPLSVDLFRQDIGGGALDGMAVDACGNVYVCEFGPAIVWRISPDGQSIEQLVNLGAETGWIPNLQFGSGHGGWDTHVLYVLEIGGQRVFEVEVGVPDKTRGYP